MVRGATQPAPATAQCAKSTKTMGTFWISAESWAPHLSENPECPRYFPRDDVERAARGD